MIIFIYLNEKDLLYKMQILTNIFILINVFQRILWKQY